MGRLGKTGVGVSVGTTGVGVWGGGVGVLGASIAIDTVALFLAGESVAGGNCSRLNRHHAPP